MSGLALWDRKAAAGEKRPGGIPPGHLPPGGGAAKGERMRNTALRRFTA